MAQSRLETLFAGMESHDDQEHVVGSYELEGGVDSMESAMADVAEAYNEVEDSEEDVTSLESIHEGLSQIHASMEQALEHDGGLSPVAADMAHLAVGAYTERFGLESDKVLPALESFGGDTGQQSSTQVSMESVGETLAKIWKAIKDAVMKAMAAVREFFKKVFSATDRIEKRIEALRGKVKDLDGMSVKAEDGKMKVGAANRLKVNDKVDAGSIGTGMDNLITMNEQIFGGYLDGAAGYYEQVGKTIGSIQMETDEGAAEKAIKTVEDEFAKITKVVAIAETKPAPGDKVVMTKAEGSQGSDSTHELKIADRSGSKKVSDNSIQVPSASDLGSLLDQAEKVLGYVKDKAKAVEEVQKARDESLKTIEGLVGASDSNKVGKVWATAKGKALLRKVQKDTLRPVTQMASLDMNVLQSLTGFVESSTKAYGKKDS